MSEQSEREAFEAMLKEDPYDASAHRVFADFLEEHGFDDESAWQRSWTPERQRSEEWLREFAKQCGDLMWDDSTREKFWECWGLVTGTAVREDVRAAVPFLCSC